MAKILTKAGITTGNTVEAFHVTQSIDAFTGIDAYDISLSGSLDVVGLTDITGDTTITGSLTINQTSISSSTESPIIEVKVDDANSYFRINNATSTDGLFSPTINTKQSDSPDRLSFYLDSVVDPTYDTPGAVDVVRFRARRDSDFIQNRDLYAWYNYTTRLMDMDPDGNLNIVASVTASSYTGSFVGDGSGITSIVSSSYAVTASYALNSPASTDTNLANTNLTLDNNRTHDLNGFRLIFESASSSVFGIGSTTGVNVNAGQADRDFRVYTQGNTSTLFVEGSSDRVGVGKNTPNATLDVNGNAIITGSLNNGSGNTSSGAVSHAEGFVTIASGLASHAEGYLTIASGSFSHAEGEQTRAIGTNSHAEGNLTLATGAVSHAEGFKTLASGLGSHAEGNQTTSSGDYSHSQGRLTKALGDYSLACGISSTAFKDYSVALNNSQASGSYQTTVGRYNVQSDNDFLSSGDIFIVGNGILSAESNAFRVSGSGDCFAGGTFTNGGADYAEYFESHDGQAIPLGTVVELTGSYIKACETADNAIGVISNKPSVLGNAEEGTADQWIGMYLKDEWGNYSYESYTFEDPIKVDENGDPIIQTGTRKVLNPDYDPSLPYTPRSSRPEWNVVGLLGQIRVLKNQNIPSRWIKMKDINDDIAIYLVK